MVPALGVALAFGAGRLGAAEPALGPMVAANTAVLIILVPTIFAILAAVLGARLMQLPLGMALAKHSERASRTLKG